MFRGKNKFQVSWGAKNPQDRGPIITSVDDKEHFTAIGTHAGTYAVQRAVAIATGDIDPHYRPDLNDTYQTDMIRPNAAWFEPEKIVSLDPFGAVVGDVFAKYIDQGYRIQPTIAVTRARIEMPEVKEAMQAQRLTADGHYLKEDGKAVVTKVAIEPVWHLPGVASRLGISEEVLRQALFEKTGGMFADLVKRPDLKVFLPPIGGLTAYIFGDPRHLADPTVPLTLRVHDECSGSDVFGSDICTCRPYLAYAIERSIAAAQKGEVGLVIYYRNEGRAMGEVSKYLIYNARKRQAGGDRAIEYFNMARLIAGTSDLRLYTLMPDALLWLGISKIDYLISMSNLKHDSMRGAGIEIIDRVTIPDELIPADAQVEIDAKKASGYHSDGAPPDKNELSKAKGRGLNDY